MNCFEGVPSATDAAVKVGLEELKFDPSLVPDGILVFQITRGDSGSRETFKRGLQTCCYMIISRRPFIRIPLISALSPPAGSPWRFQTKVFIESLPCKAADERTHYYLRYMHHFCLQLNYFQARWPLLNYNAFLDAFIPAANYRTNGRFLKVWLIFFHKRDFPEETFPLLHPFCILSPPPQLFLCPTDESSCPFGIAVIFKMESDRAEPLAFRRSSGMRQVARSVLKRACHPGTDVAWRRGGAEESSFLAAV